MYGGPGSDDISLGPGSDFGSGGEGSDVICGERCTVLRRYDSDNAPVFANGEWARNVMLQRFVTLDQTFTISNHVCAVYEDSAQLMISDFVLASSNADSTSEHYMSAATELLGPGSVTLNDAIQVSRVTLAVDMLTTRAG